MDAAGAGPGRRGAHPFGDPAAAGAVVDVAHQLGAQGGGQQHLAVAGEPGHGRTVAGLDHGEGGAGAFHLACGAGEQFPGGGCLGAEDGGEFRYGEAVADGEFEGLALLGGGSGGFGPGEAGQLGTAVGAHVQRPRRMLFVGVLRRAPGGMRPLAGAPLFAQPGEAAPAGQCVEPGPPVPFVGAPAGMPFGDGEDLTEHVGGGVVVTQHRQAVSEQSVEVGLVPEGGGCSSAGPSSGPREGVRPCARCAPVRAGGCGWLLLFTRRP